MLQTDWTQRSNSRSWRMVGSFCWSMPLSLILGFQVWLTCIYSQDPPLQSGWEWTGPDAELHKQVAKDLSQQFEHLFEKMSPEAKAGYRHLVQNVYLPSDFDEDVMQRLDHLPLEVPLQDVTLASDQRQATWMRFGLVGRPDESSLPLQYILTDDKKYVMNCFACHGGNLYGAAYPGAPNTLYALESLTENVRLQKLRLGKPLTHMDVGSLAMPLGTTVGSSNAVMFGVALLNYRDAELNIYPTRFPARLTNHDMDAPPWWHFRRKHHIYIDGFAEKGHRGLMQFMLVKENGPQQFQQWENEFRDVFAFLSELQPPRYPLPIEQDEAARGKVIFEQHCAECHGTYGEGGAYPEKRIRLSEVGTDPLRLQALTVQHRANYAASWFAHLGQQQTETEVDGYVAPPLDGIWASAPYFHNGSVPTLWDVLHPEERPSVWRRTGLGLDHQRLGLQVERLENMPRVDESYQRRWYFDTKRAGKSASGHDYPNALSEREKESLLEYLKTL